MTDEKLKQIEKNIQRLQKRLLKSEKALNKIWGRTK